MAKPNNGKTSAHATGAQLARHIALSPQMISRLVKAGVVAPEPDGKFDLDTCRISYIQSLRKRAVAKSGSADEYRALKNKKLAIELAQLDGRLIDLEEANLFYAALTSSFKNALYGLGARLTRDVAERARIDNLADVILTDLANDYGRQFEALKTTGRLPDADVTEDDEGDFNDDETIPSSHAS